LPACHQPSALPVITGMTDRVSVFGRSANSQYFGFGVIRVVQGRL
jgi:hypothetical protein